ncbi:MAG: hypothetical protein M0Z54_14765 [Thermaerobacter sp.]|nr:hypothetical protein [Thermaerobacter sp.]
MSYGRRLVRRALGTGGRSGHSGVLGAALDASAQAYAQLLRVPRVVKQSAAGPPGMRPGTPAAWFAHRVAEALERQGWCLIGPVEHPSGDASLIGEDPWGTRCVVQCPLGAQGVVDVEAVYVAVAARDAWACDQSMVVAPDGVRFTHAARDYARGADVSLRRLLSSGEVARAAP